MGKTPYSQKNAGSRRRLAAALQSETYLSSVRLTRRYTALGSKGVCSGRKLLVVVQQAEDILVGEALAAAQEVEFYSQGQADDFTAKLINQLERCFHGPAGGEQIVHKQYALATLDSILMDL